MSTNTYPAFVNVARTQSTTKLVNTVRAITAQPTMNPAERLVRSASVTALRERYSEAEAAFNTAVESEADPDGVSGAVVAAAVTATASVTIVAPGTYRDSAGRAFQVGAGQTGQLLNNGTGGPWNIVALDNGGVVGIHEDDYIHTACSGIGCADCAE